MYRPCRRSILPLLVMVVAGGGCEDGSEADQAASESWAVEEFARLGSVEDPNTSFADVADILVADGGLYVLEWGQPRIVVFDAEGDWVRNFASSGDGPGELRGPESLGLTGSQLWVRDPRGARLETYSLEGDPQESFRFTISPDSLGVIMSARALLEDGTLLAGPSTRRITAQLRGNIRYADHAKVDSLGQVLELFYRAEYGEGDAFAADVGDGRQMIGLHPIQESPLVEPFPDGSGLVVVERFIPQQAGEDTFRLLVLDASGEPVVDASIPYDPVRAEGWRERHIQRLRESAQGRNLPESMIQGLRADLPERVFFPPVSELVPGADGTIWLKREPVDTVRATWEAYDQTGSMVGRVDLPTDFQLRHASREELWGFQLDDLDVPYVVGLRIVP